MTAAKPKETAAFICSRDTLYGAYLPLILSAAQNSSFQAAASLGLRRSLRVTG
jgi:hypothetical protein